MTIKVLLADDQALLRGTFRLLIDHEPDMIVVAEASDGAEAVRLARAHLPDVILMDIRMPGLDGIEAARRIGADATLAGARVVVLTTFEIQGYVVEALYAGAAGFLGKNVEPADLLSAIRTVVAGDALISPAATRELLTHFTEQAAVRAPADPLAATRLASLTPREHEVTVLTAQGLSNQEIAEELHVTTLTAKTHVNRAMMKLGARDRSQLVVLAYRHRLVRPETWS